MIAEFNGKISEDVKEGVLAFIFAVFFLILKDKNSQGGSVSMGFRRGGLGSNVQVVEESALVEAKLAVDGKIYPI